MGVGCGDCVLLQSTVTPLLLDAMDIALLDTERFSMSTVRADVEICGGVYPEVEGMLSSISPLCTDTVL